ncbi:glyoxalase superfamily protein [Ottowia thiooxydans]|uniref:glyoxalase superfamily protein n=1 Tax=Ottowia thiooxydans TaxID=219182 RepID=UPI003392049E
MEQHRFGPVLPPYLQVSCEGRVQHLVEHHSGACRGGVLRVACNGIYGFHGRQAAKHHGHACPGIDHTGLGTREVTVRHSFGNRLTFANAVST